MPKVIMVCGKLCSGKTAYAEGLRKAGRAVILSVDEIMLALFDQDAGEKHDEYTARIKGYLYQKSLELIGGGTDVILDWGFWTKEERDRARSFYASHGIANEFHYIGIDDGEWRRRIEKRNRDVLVGSGNAYFVDEGLLAKSCALFEEPDPSETDLRVPVSPDPC